jgi:putative addiction module component (TIGR02574 family)
MTAHPKHPHDPLHDKPLEMMLTQLIKRQANQPDPEIEKQWIAVAKRRLKELRSGKVQAVPAEEVFTRIRQRFELLESQPE